MSSPVDGRPFLAFTAAHAAAVESALERLLPPPAPGLDAELHRAMRYSVFPGGKRLRPMLALMGCAVSGGDLERAFVPAAGIELLHTYSLVHDDLPCMDDDDLRRGRPTCHVVFGEALAVLAGDALLTLAFEAVAAAGAEAVRVLARAAGSGGMVGGQAADMAAEGGALRPSLDHARWIHDRKTGALIAAALEVGALAGGAAAPPAALRPFGELLGRAFQVADDCLDVVGETARTGKRTGQDAAAAKLTFPAVLGLEASQAEARRLAEAAAELAPAVCAASPSRQGSLDWAVALLQDCARFAVSREA
jgi:geranylgeranyl pyrophosphate synthase